MATDMITVEGKKVHFMYRDKPHNALDSGWRFFSGLEKDDYFDDSKNIAIYDVNTIANYDQSIIPFLTFPVGSVFERDQKTGNWNQVFDYVIPEML